MNNSDHFDACNKQAHRGLCNRDIIDSPFGGLPKILCMDPLQHKLLGIVVGTTLFQQFTTVVV